MSDSENKNQGESSTPPPVNAKASVSSRLAQFEKRQKELWRVTFLILLVLATVFAATSWDTLRSLTHRYEALPIGLVILVVLFGMHVWKRSQEISELRGLVQGIEQRDAEPASEKQFDQLFDRITRSQQGYRDLIDSFDDILIAMTLDGEIRAVNRRFAELVGAPYQDIVGKPLSDFVQEAAGEGQVLVKRAMPKFLERRTWSGVALYRIDMMNALIATLLPEPVDPAINRCGMPLRSAVTMRPLISLPMASVSFDFEPMNSCDSIFSRSQMISRSRFGT